MRKMLAALSLTVLFAAIVGIFWYQEIQYLLPTPIPENYKVVLPNEIIKFDTMLLPQRHDKPKLLHFFNPDCPCSRFNLRHFQALTKEYNRHVDFYAVVASHDLVESAKKMIEKNVTIVVDENQQLAEACGVYSTPQAALIQTSNTLYYRGNFNRSRYCTDANSNYVQMAIDSLVARKGPPHFSELATRSYGCSIEPEENLFTPIVK
jgi:hypothetical protein